MQIMKLFYFKSTRKPDFQNVKKFDYEKYWEERGFTLRSKLMEREYVFFDWIPKESRVLDCGCGNSRLLYELKAKKGCKVFGLDISQKVILELEKMGISGRVSDIEKDDFSDLNGFDFIILSEVLEHIKYPEDLIRKLKNHTKSFLISVPNSAFYRYRLHLMFTGRFFTQWAFHPAEHVRYWSHKDFKEWLTSQDVTLEKFKAASGFELKNIWPNMFCADGCYNIKTKVL